MATEAETVRIPSTHPDTRPVAAPATGTRSRSRRIVLVVMLAALAAAGVVAWRTFFLTAAPTGIIVVSGRIEGDDSVVAPRTAGRILELRVHEGDSVQAGDTLAVLDDEQVRAREERARAALSAAEARGAAARQQIGVLEARLRQADLQTDQSKLDAQGRVEQAEAELAAAEAQLAQQRASSQLAVFDRDAYLRLAQTGAASERQGKQAASAAEQQAAVVVAAERRVDSARSALATARANLQAIPGIRSAEAIVVRRQLAQQNAEVLSAAAQIEQARAELAEAEANRQDLTIRAPFAGTVATRVAAPGEIVMSGSAIVTLVDLSQVYLRGYVPEGRIGHVKVGQPARIYLDSDPNRPIDAQVSRIDPQATFTPENTYFQDDRVKQVVGVKLQIKGAFGFAKPGMPADGEILVSGDAWPTTSRRT
jgi:HlyD family secretion protein